MKLWKDWEEIWFNMADADKVQYDSLKGTEETEFYNLMDFHKKKIDKLKQSNNARK